MINRDTWGMHANKRKKAALIALVLCTTLIPLLAACSSPGGAEQKTAEELDALKVSKALGSEVTGLRDSLSEEGKEDFDEFLAKVRDFDYEISGSEEDGSVSVRIRTCDFGREYLAVWTEYLRSHRDALGDDEDLRDFYELLFDRLSDLDEKTYIKDVDIMCTEDSESGEWSADIKGSEELQDAVFGGMISEMEALAAE